MKKTKAYTLHLTEELAQMVEFCARQERRPVAQLLALWVEDVARVQTLKKCDLGGEPFKPLKYYGED